MNLTIPLAALTLMMWIVWRESVRPRRSSPMVSWFRVVLYLTACGVLGWSLWRDWRFVGLATVVLTIFAIAFGLGSAAYFARQARAR